MNIETLVKILNESTMIINDDTALPQGAVEVDCVLTKVFVHVENAKKVKSDLCEFLKTYPQPDRLSKGPSFIEVGGEIGDQGMALRLFSLGDVLNLWNLITPKTFDMHGDQARDAAGGGFVMISGYKVSS